MTNFFRQFDAVNPGAIKFKTDACQNGTDGIYYLEHVLMVTDLNHTRRGNLGIYLVSPSGTIIFNCHKKDFDQQKLYVFF